LKYKCLKSLEILWIDRVPLRVDDFVLIKSLKKLIVEEISPGDVERLKKFAPNAMMGEEEGEEWDHYWDFGQ